MINCLVVDDEEHAIEVILHYLKQVPYLNLVAATTNPIEALQLVNTHKIDLIFLDIQMPAISGLDFIRTMKGNSRVIFTTAFSEFATEGFDLEAVDYLLKPIPLPRFLKAAQRALNAITTAASKISTDEGIENDYIFVKTEYKGKMLKINLHEIDYIEGMKNYVAIHHDGRTTLALLNMKDLEERLPAKHFMRVHKSFIVAIQKITAVEGNQILLDDPKAKIFLGETYRSSFLKLMKKNLM